MDLTGRTAFITGGASGIGYALAARCARAGMHVVLADLDDGPLADAAERLRASGAAVSAERLDVADRGQYEELAARVLRDHGAPGFLANNAGVSCACPISTGKIDDWNWVVDVNIKGVLHGLSLFTPAMLEAGAGGYIVNTASMAGLAPGYGDIAVYSMTKHAVVVASEALALEVMDRGIGVAVLCPGRVVTNIVDADRVRPGGTPQPDAQGTALREQARAWLSGGMNPDDVAEQVFAALDEGRFYVFTHPEYKTSVARRMQQVLAAFRGEASTDAKMLAMAQAMARPTLR